VPENSTPQIELTYKPIGKNGRMRVSVLVNGKPVIVDQIAVASESKREAFIERVAAELPGIDRTALRARLTAMAGESIEEDDGDIPRQNAALVALGNDAELFHCGDAAYATVPVGEHRETHALKSRGFKLWLNRGFYEQNGTPPASQALSDALATLEARALFEGPEHAVCVRVADYDGAYWLDLGDADHQAVRIDDTGWQVVADPPVRLLRPRGLLPLPSPVVGGSLEDLRKLLNLPDELSWALALAWLVAAIRPSGPYPILIVNGEQGSGKSSFCRLLRAIIDPNTAPLRAEPREARDLMIAAVNAHVLGFDNLSGVLPWLADGLCRLATGGGFATRELYSDDQERIFDATRPIILNGIDELSGRPDLLDRAIILTLPTISPGERRTERELLRQFDRVRPGVLGALLTAVSRGMRELQRVTLTELPRMADFAMWAVACESGLGLRAGSFMSAYTSNCEASDALALESSMIGPAVVGLMHSRHDWTGTARELLSELETHHSDERTRRSPHWPKPPRKLGGDLRRIAPNLRAAGIGVAFTKGGRRSARIITIDKLGAEPSAPSAPSANPPGAVDNAASCGRSGSEIPSAIEPYRPRPSAEIGPGGLRTPNADYADDTDGVAPASVGAVREVLDL